MKPVEYTKEELDRQKRYKQTEPSQFGNLHERMKYLISLIEEDSFAKDKKYHDIRVAVYDLETEVSFTYPASPPYGQRYYPLDNK